MPEQHAPEQIQPKSLDDYLEVMSKSVFQTGISWRVVESKWPDIRSAFHDFHVHTVAGLSAPQVDELTQDKRVIRNRRKLEAIVGNANRMVELEREHGSFRNYLRSHSNFESTVKDLRKQFKFLGDTGCYHFLLVVNEEVPSYEEWCASRGRTPQTLAH